MSVGTLKSLTKALDQFLSKREVSVILPLELKKTIEEYLLKHNTFESNNSKRLSDALYGLYKNYVTSDFSKDIVFISILKLLICNIVDHNEFTMWIKKYLKVSIDSAGQDIKFVEASRDLIMLTLSLKTELSGELQDKQMDTVRKLHADKVVTMLIDYYLRPKSIFEDENIYDEESQELEERNRFIKMNIRLTLEKYAKFDFMNYCKLINEYIIKPKYRMETLTLLSFYIAEQDHDTLKMMAETPLWRNILNVLLFDNSKQAVNCALNVLIMIIPHIASILLHNLPVLLQTLARLIIWTIEDEDHNRNDYQVDFQSDSITPTNEKEDLFDKKGREIAQSDWEILEGDTLDEGLTLDYFKLAVFLYGLFPISLTDFIRHPEIKEKHTRMFQERLKHLIQNFTVHENFILYNSKVEEIKSYSRFVSSLKSPEELKIKCFQYILMSENNATNNETRTLVNTVKTRNSSLSTDLDSESPLSPTFLSPNLYPQHDAPVFNTPNFSKVSSNTQLSSPTENHKVVDGLLDTHKQLFFKNDNSIYSDFIRRHSIQSSLADSDNSTPYYTNGASNLIDSITNANAASGGASSDFYKRELMILMNELDFQAYIRQNSIFRIKQLTDENKNIRNKLEQLNIDTEQINLLKAESHQLREELNSLKSAHVMDTDVTPKLQITKIIHNNTELKENKRQLEGEVIALESKIVELQAEISELKSETSQTAIELSSLRNSLSVLQAENASLKTKITIKEKADLERKKNIKDKSYQTLSLQEKRIFSLEEQIKAIEKKYEEELTKVNNDYKERLNALNDELTAAKNTNLKTSNSLLKRMTETYESKIAYLHSAVSQLQEDASLKEEELIMLRTTKPINIPHSISGSAASLLNRSHMENRFDRLAPTDQELSYFPKFDSRSSSDQNSGGYPTTPTFANNHGSVPSLPNANSKQRVPSSSNQSHASPPAQTPISLPTLGGVSFFKKPANTSQPTTDTASIVVKGRGGVQRKTRLKM